MRPYDAKTHKDLLSLESDNADGGDCWILLGERDGGAVTIAEQKLGESATQMITLSRKKFNKLIDWYLRDQSTAKKRRKTAA